MSVKRKAADTKEKTSKPASPAPQSEDQKKAERLAKLEAWKRKIAEDKERKEKEVSAGGTRKLLDDIMQGTNGTSATASPASPATPASPKPYAGKFDPKAIAKKASGHSQATTTLGKDLSLKELPKASATSTSMVNGLKADNKPTAFSNASTGECEHPQICSISANCLSKASALPKARNNLSAFGFGSKTGSEQEKTGSKRALDFGEDEDSRKRLEKLPSLPLANVDDGDAALTNVDEEEDEDIDMEDGGNEEEAAAAARAAAEKREERLQEQSLAETQDVTTLANTGDDVKMEDVKPETAEVEDEEEIDPLDAFMDDLGDPFAAPGAVSFIKNKSKAQQQEPEAMFGDDEVGLKTIEADPDDILAIASKARKKKELPTVNYAKLDLDPFRKNFYHEPAELAEMTEEEVADLRLELDDIKVSGKDVPKPVQKWSQCGLNIQSLDVIQKLGYERPTSIQSQAIPAIMSGRDVIGVAKTGSGKTIAFLLPMFRHIRDQKPLETNDGPVGLVMTPTRELATQIHRECKPFLKAMGLRAVCAYGGAPIKDQIAELKRGAEIIVCTPGRMIDLLAANSGRVTNLRRVTYIVLDEADRMFDMGFEPQVMKIFANIRPNRQTILFSATMPRIMDALAKKTLNNPVEITVGGRSVVAPDITQIVEVREEKAKFRRLLELLGELYNTDEDARSLIFVDRQEKADELFKDLVQKGYVHCMSLHGGKDQVDRDYTIDNFKNGVTNILIATSVAARGLDVKQLKLVVNYDAPNHLEDYVHRAGRTGRAGNKGTAVTFITEDQEQYSVGIAKALEQSGNEVPEQIEAMRKSFREKVKAGKSKDSSGFGGKGLERLDADREAAKNRERKTHKVEGEEEDEKDEKEDDDLVLKAASTVQSASAPAPPQPLPGVPKGIDLDGAITVHKTETPTSGGPGDKFGKVNSAAEAINARLNKTGQLRSGVPIDNKGPDAGAFHATLEINDFPQRARWAVTNRTNVAKVLEATGTSITTKGSFYPAGKEVPVGGDPKLYILVEGDTELVVTNAMRELMRHLKEGTIAAAESEGRAPTGGRYTV